MCLILFAIAPLDEYQLVVAANRDEYYDRPSRPAMFWPENPEILAGKDMSMGGTWLGITKSGRFAAVTNFRETPAHPIPPLSRGDLTTRFLSGSEPALSYLQEVAARADQYRGFNLILGDADGFYYFTNQSSKIIRLEPGYYGLSNQLLNCDWPKVIEGQEKLEHAVRQPALADALSMVLCDEGDHRAFSNSFIASEEYGTRARTVVIWKKDGDLSFEEQCYAKNGVAEGLQKHSFTVIN